MLIDFLDVFVRRILVTNIFPTSMSLTFTLVQYLYVQVGKNWSNYLEERTYRLEKIGRIILRKEVFYKWRKEQLEDSIISVILQGKELGECPTW